MGFACFNGHAQALWPNKPVKILVGFAAGSTPDTSARLMAASLSVALGQPVIVENKPGAAGNIAADLLARSTDQHTLGVLINGNLTNAKSMYPGLGFDPVKDFAPISLLTSSPLLWVTANGLPDAKSFIKQAQQAGERWSYGSSGKGTLSHLGMELLKTKLPGMSPVHIPFPNNPAVLQALINRDIQMALLPPAVALAPWRAGQIQIIAIAGQRSPLAPDIPSLAEIGLKNINLQVWTALVAPASLPQPIQDRISKEIRQIYKEPDLQKKLTASGWQPIGSSPQELRTLLVEENLQIGRLESHHIQTND